MMCATVENKTMPNFVSWTRENLDKFAYDAYAKLQAQDDRIQQLQCDLQDAIAAYRALIKEQELSRT
jgi:hypothetical protein